VCGGETLSHATRRDDANEILHAGLRVQSRQLFLVETLNHGLVGMRLLRQRRNRARIAATIPTSFDLYMWQRPSPLAWIPVANYTGAEMARRVRTVRNARIWRVAASSGTGIAFDYGQLQESSRLLAAQPDSRQSFAGECEAV
jgi:hypothetical protein